MGDKLESGIRKEMGNVSLRPGEIVVQTEHLMAVRQKSFAQMGADKSGPTRYKNPL